MSRYLLTLQPSGTPTIGFLPRVIVGASAPSSRLATSGPPSRVAIGTHRSATFSLGLPLAYPLRPATGSQRIS